MTNFHSLDEFKDRFEGRGAWARAALTASGEMAAGSPLEDQTRSAKVRMAEMIWISLVVMGNFRNRRSASGTGPPKRREAV